MAKRQRYFAEAERLYVSEQLSLAEIASRLALAERTVRTWKAEGDWEGKRAQLCKETQRFDEELYLFARQLLRQITADLAQGEKVETGRLYTLTRLLPLIAKVRDYENAAASREREDAPKPGLKDDVLRIIEEGLGIR